jgi:hypothetical protein
MGNNFENFREEISKLKKREIALIVFGVLIVYQVASSYFDSGSSSSNSYTTGAVTTSTNWIPAGFTSWDQEVAYKWVDNPTCNSYSVCAAVQVVANKDCSNNLYAELILQDKDYVQYDYTNDSQGSLTRGSTAELTFNFPPDDRFAHFKLSKISCR